MGRRLGGCLLVLAAGVAPVGPCRQAKAAGKGEPATKPTRNRARSATVGDCLWLWGHPAGAHNGGYGLEGKSGITPAAAAARMGIRNIVMVRYARSPSPPFGDYARTVAGLDRVVWSVEGPGGDDVDAALKLRRVLPNLRGIMMDDYFQRVPSPTNPLRKMWLAENKVAFPVDLLLTLAAPLAPDRLELVQSNWRTGDYLSKGFSVELSADGKAWRAAAQGTLPRRGGASAMVKLPATPAKAIRIRILSTHDRKAAVSCGLSRVRLWAKGRLVPDEAIRATAGSHYPGHPAANVLTDELMQSAFSLDALKPFRKRLDAAVPPLPLWVVLYTHELHMPHLRPHLRLCDVVTLWTWNGRDLAHLEANMRRCEKIVGDKAKVLGLYMYDYGARKPMPVERMKSQCETTLRWLRTGRIEGMIFLASCICDLDLEAVAWSRRWIAKVADDPLPAVRTAPRPSRRHGAASFRRTPRDDR